MTPLLTTDDLDELGAEALAVRDPRPVARRIVAAVDGGGLADPDDAGYALSLAGDLHERAGDHDEALALSARSVEAGAGTDDATWLHAMHADRLLRAGREDEGMAALTTLRPSLHRDASAVLPITDALTENGHAEIAEQWLTAALLTAIEREESLEEGTDEQLDAADVVDELMIRRRHVRADLGREPDEYDALADEADAAPDLVFFPQAELTRLLAEQPDMADELGADWDAHRAMVERELQDAAAEGEVLEVEVATPALVAAIVDDSPTSPAADPVGELLAWPPGRNDPCWCGSGAKYKKCCLPRARAQAAPVPAPEPPPAAPAAPASTERVIKRGSGSRTRAR